ANRCVGVVIDHVGHVESRVVAHVCRAHVGRGGLHTVARRRLAHLTRRAQHAAAVAQETPAAAVGQRFTSARPAVCVGGAVTRADTIHVVGPRRHTQRGVRTAHRALVGAGGTERGTASVDTQAAHRVTALPHGTGHAVAALVDRTLYTAKRATCERDT